MLTATQRNIETDKSSRYASLSDKIEESKAALRLAAEMSLYYYQKQLSRVRRENAKGAKRGLRLAAGSRGAGKKVRRAKRAGSVVTICRNTNH